ncbi:hypothetical protein Cgig2_030154 [Carnegiea gigantea]|uniref:Uncharacterized protein n=1 Tax=Carnegiea gigantea TaxID=171969 RepID=A0A9Q1GIX7_9CARY|nr:hypothetical protein Cgig2_030154 [Carnegiea gigantea]
MSHILTAKASPCDIEGTLSRAINLVASNPTSWQSAILSNAVIFALGSPILVAGLSLSGIAAAFVLGTLTWRAFGPPGFLLVATYFVLNQPQIKSVCAMEYLFPTTLVQSDSSVAQKGHVNLADIILLSGFGEIVEHLKHCSIDLPKSYISTCLSDDRIGPFSILKGTAATKVKMAQKEAQGVAEKRKGRRGPGSVIGSSAAGCVCTFLWIYGVGGKALSHLWQLGFVASFCTKLSDTVSSEMGKAYGKITSISRMLKAVFVGRYLVTTFKVVPRGTEGAVSVEGTIAGLLASVLLAFVGCLTGQINAREATVCVLASQIANFGESVIGASLQEKEGFQWVGYLLVFILNNDAVNIINISMGSILAILLQQFVLRS